MLTMFEQIREDLLLEGITIDEASWLLSARGHLHMMHTRRALMVISRVRLFAALFCLGLIAWIPVDILLLPPPLALGIGILRCIFAAAFAALAIGFRRRTAIRTAYKALAALFLIGLGFVAAVFTLINLAGGDMVSVSANAGYGFFPFALMALLGVFPLTLMECVLFGGPLLLLQGVAIAYHWNVLPWASPIHAFWLLALIGTLAALSSLSQLAFAIALVHQAMRDPLTRCFTRQSGLEMLEMQLHQCWRTGVPLSLAFVDLDHFKRINDSFGHEAGDAALISVAGAIKPLVRREDMLVRWGGEEFLLVLPGSSIWHGRQVVERMRARGFGVGPDGLPVTASIGLVECLADHVEDATALIRLADERMYLAKQRGRDAIVWEGGDGDKPLSLPQAA